MSNSGYTKCQAVHCCYVKTNENYYIILLLYVGDLLIIRSNMEKIKDMKEQLSKEFEMKTLDSTKKILSIRINRDRSAGTLKLSRVEYVGNILIRFNMNEKKSISTPLVSHFKLSKKQSSNTKEDNEHMKETPCLRSWGVRCML